VQPSGNSRVHRERRPPIRRLIHTVTENSLSIVLFTLFVICISGDSVAGWHLQNEMLAAHGRASVGYGHFLSTGAFLEGLAAAPTAIFTSGATRKKGPSRPLLT
jgi:hypothetical protein